jgi:hypothetical protein
MAVESIAELRRALGRVGQRLTSETGTVAREAAREANVACRADIVCRSIVVRLVRMPYLAEDATRTTKLGSDRALET